jgi:hypothetical protein
MPPQSFSLSQKLSAFFNLLCNRLVRKKAGSHGQRLSERAYSLILPSCSSQGSFLSRLQLCYLWVLLRHYLSESLADFIAWSVWQPMQHP